MSWRWLNTPSGLMGSSDLIPVLLCLHAQLLIYVLNRLLLQPTSFVAFALYFLMYVCFHFFDSLPEGEKEGASEWLHVAWFPGGVKPQQPF